MAGSFDVTLAEVMVGAYAYDNRPYPWDWYGEPADVAVGIKEIDWLGQRYAVVCFIGSRDKKDWERDFTFFPSRVGHPTLGILHEGFAAGLDIALAALLPELTKRGLPVVVIGHSLGAARAPIYTGEFLQHGLQINKLVCFAPPRPGYALLGQMLLPVPKVLYRTVALEGCGHDYVTDLPLPLPLPFRHVGPLSDVPVRPLPHDTWGMFCFHHAQLYLAGLQATMGVEVET